MANQEQLDVIRQGRDAWNAWRKKHSKVAIDLSKADLSDTYLTRINLSDAYLSDAYLSEATLSMANFTRADLSGVDLNKADLSGANFTRADLSGVDLSWVNLNGANLNKADLSDAALNWANLSKANLSKANLSKANLIRANLSGANLYQTNFHKAIVFATIFADLDLRQAKELETVKHRGPSTIGADTLLRSEGNIPEMFLKEAGLSDTFITYARSLTQQPLQYYTCFISYSSKDQDFAERLHADLQSKGVRCWFAPEDLKIGDRFRNRIDEAVRVYDKLVLVLSEHSVKSPWVETEVEAAFEKEHRRKCITLFPVKLDETVMKTRKAWAADIRRTRHIGDFTRWKEHDTYQRSFQRVLRDLNTTIPTSKP